MRERIVELRHQGLSIREVAELLALSPRTIQKYSPPSNQLRKRPATARNDWLDHDEYGDVVPIPFYPEDLPRLRFTYLTTAQRAYVLAEQARILFPVAVV